MNQLIDVLQQHAKLFLHFSTHLYKIHFYLYKTLNLIQISKYQVQLLIIQLFLFCSILLNHLSFLFSLQIFYLLFYLLIFFIFYFLYYHHLSRLNRNLQNLNHFQVCQLVFLFLTFYHLFFLYFYFLQFIFIFSILSI